MESCSAFDDVAIGGERDASFADDRVEFLDRFDVFVDDGLVDERPQGFRRLQLRRVGRQKDQPHAIGHAQTRFAMPAGVVEHEHDRAIDAGLRFACEGCEQRRKKRLRDAVVHIPEGLAARRRDKGGDIKPVEAVMAMRCRPLADRRPNAPRDRFQAKPVFVAGEDFDWPLRMFRGFLGDGVFEVFLNAAAASGEAHFGFLGRGAWIDMPQAFSASQPR
jgi:hypothetical protein